MLLVLDAADDETRRVATMFSERHEHIAVIEVQVRDLSLARNAAIEEARGTFVGIHDGDDLFSTNWLLDSLRKLDALDGQRILHPELTIVFDQWSGYYWQFGQDDKERFRPHALLTANFWNAASLSRRSVYLDHPYEIARAGEAGFGYEDWHWNCETIASGLRHDVTEGTIRFERRKACGSLNAAHTASNAVVRPSKFFDMLEP